MGLRPQFEVFYYNLLTFSKVLGFKKLSHAVSLGLTFYKVMAAILKMVAIFVESERPRSQKLSEGLS